MIFCLDSSFFPLIRQFLYSFLKISKFGIYFQGLTGNRIPPGFRTFSGGLVEVCGIRRVRPRLLQEIKSKHLYTYKVLCKLYRHVQLYHGLLFKLGCGHAGWPGTRKPRRGRRRTHDEVLRCEVRRDGCFKTDDETERLFRALAS